MIVFATALFTWLGSKRWFHADDWNYLLYRDVLHPDGRLSERLWTAHNGHPVAVPAIQFSLTDELFGVRSYLPFIATSIVLHLACAVVLRVLMVRIGIRELTATVVAAAVLLIGASSEFPVFASISSYQYSLLAMLLVMLIVDVYPDGAWQHWIAAALGVIAVLASSFGALFAVAIALATLGRRRWRTAATILVPQLLVFGWWWLSWGGDDVAESRPSGVPAFVTELYRQVFDGLAGFGLGAVATAATVLFGVAMSGWAAGSRLVGPLFATSLVAFVVIGVQRSEFGTSTAAVGRYVVVGAFLVAPAFALAIDRLRDVGRGPYFAALALVVVSISANVVEFRDLQLAVADATEADRTMLELLAGSPEAGTLPPDLRPSEYSPDIMVRHLDALAERGAIEPRPPQTAAERTIVEEAIALGRSRAGS